jgi:hypothetical protein
MLTILLVAGLVAAATDTGGRTPGRVVLARGAGAPHSLRLKVRTISMSRSITSRTNFAGLEAHHDPRITMIANAMVSTVIGAAIAQKRGDAVASVTGNDVGEA